MKLGEITVFCVVQPKVICQNNDDNGDTKLSIESECLIMMGKKISLIGKKKIKTPVVQGMRMHC